MKNNNVILQICYIFCYIFLCLFLLSLGGCSTTEPSTAITEAIKADIKVIEKQVEVVKKTMPAQCQTPAIITQLNTIQEAIKTISTKAHTGAIFCETEKEVYKQQINKLHLIIAVLFVIGGVLGFLLTKKRLLL